jgi:hypothetical protein
MLLLLQSLLDSAGVPISDSLRIDTAELISGAYVIGDVGLGVLGSTVPSTGEHGPSYLYNDLVLPDDAGKEIRGLIVTPPSAGTFFAFEDGSFTLVGAPDGTYTFVYRLFVDGVDFGTAEATIVIGVDGLQGTAVLSGITASGTIIGGGFPDIPLTNIQMQQLFAWVNELALVHGLVAGSDLVVTPTTRSAGTVAQIISTAGSTVTVSR